MRFDLFCSLAPTPIGGVVPDDADLLRGFLEQCVVADELGYGTVWVAESHYSVELQKRHREPVLPHWAGEIGLNSDICQLAPRVFARTGRLEVGSAIMNVICNGGPLAAAERVVTALTWHGLEPDERRRLHIGFAAGRFDYINRLSGVVPRTEWERLAWPEVRNAIMWEAGEIFVRLVTGATLSSDDVPEQVLRAERFRDPQRWADLTRAAGRSGADELVVPRRWPFEVTRIVPTGPRRELLQLVLGSHDPDLQAHLNRFAPVRVFNLSITPAGVIEATHERMRDAYHHGGGPWRREYLPRTTFVFLDATPGRSASQRRAAARERAGRALEAYWRAMTGTVDPARVAQAADNALIGDPDEVAGQIAARFHPEDALMLWFDFLTHDQAEIVAGMTAMMTEVAPRLAERGITVHHPS